MGTDKHSQRETLLIRTIVKMASFLDLKKQFIFYASYHNHPVNVLIHLACIWNLMWSGMCLLHSTAAMVLFLHKWTFELVTANAPVQGYPLLHAVIVFHVVMWIAQFIGHGVFEGRAPALLDSWQQAFITAPLFVVLEVLFFFGYRKQFYEECMKEVEQNILEFKKAKAA